MLLLLLIDYSNAQSYYRTTVFTDSTCSDTFSYTSQLFNSTTTCRPPDKINSDKCFQSLNKEIPSTSADTCENNNIYSNSPWLPTKMANHIKGSQYFLQQSFVANNQCFPIGAPAENIYFKANCTSQSSSLTICSDSKCLNCPPSLAITPYQSSLGNNISLSSVTGQNLKCLKNMDLNCVLDATFPPSFTNTGSNWNKPDPNATFPVNTSPTPTGGALHSTLSPLVYLLLLISI
ncbi:hypothetical protein HDV02_000305 [Globomyces sp. JEL0801]|nr:hypothetical protein HDV02_000305 [Globomyces sp. JEL0801]